MTLEHKDEAQKYHMFWLCLENRSGYSSLESFCRSTGRSKKESCLNTSNLDEENQKRFQNSDEFQTRKQSGCKRIKVDGRKPFSLLVRIFLLILKIYGNAT